MNMPRFRTMFASQVYTGSSSPLSHLLARSYSTSQKKINLKKASSRQWLIRQINDKYVKRARLEMYRCRSAFKLLEINDRFSILEPGMSVLDCGASPGSWSQVAAKLVNSTGAEDDQKVGYVLSLDRDFFQPVNGCLCIRNADFTQDTTKIKLHKLLEGRKLDVLLSDMAPNASGHKEMDHEQIVDLQMQFVEFAMHVLADNGTLLCKLWEGGRTRHFQTYLETQFDNVRIVKPDASRLNSAEIFVLARGFENPKKACHYDPKDSLPHKNA